MTGVGIPQSEALLVDPFEAREKFSFIDRIFEIGIHATINDTYELASAMFRCSRPLFTKRMEDFRAK